MVQCSCPNLPLERTAEDEDDTLFSFESAASSRPERPNKTYGVYNGHGGLEASASELALAQLEGS